MNCLTLCCGDDKGRPSNPLGDRHLLRYCLATLDEGGLRLVVQRIPARDRGYFKNRGRNATIFIVVVLMLGLLVVPRVFIPLTNKDTIISPHQRQDCRCYSLVWQLRLMLGLETGPQCCGTLHKRGALLGFRQAMLTLRHCLC